MIKYPVILGSASPRRFELLQSIIENPIEVVTVDIDESLNPELSAIDQPKFLSNQKMNALISTYSLNDKLIITADTLVILDQQVLGKPSSKKEAIQMLQALSGHTHQVVTGVTIQLNDIRSSFYEITEVTFGSLTDAEIKYSVIKDQVMDKAGAYGIQDWLGKIGISKISGCYYNVMGLPLHRLFQELKKMELV